MISFLTVKKGDNWAEFSCVYCGKKQENIGYTVRYINKIGLTSDERVFCSEHCGRLWFKEAQAKAEKEDAAEREKKDAEKQAKEAERQAALNAEIEREREEARRKREEQKAREEAFVKKQWAESNRINKMDGWVNTKIDSGKRREFMNETIEHFKCKCCGKKSPGLITIVRADGEHVYTFSLNSSEGCEEFATKYQPVVIGTGDRLGRYLNTYIMDDQDDFEAAKQTLRDEDLFQEDISVKYNDVETFDGHLNLKQWNESGVEKSNYIVSNFSYYSEKPYKIDGSDFVSKKLEIYTTKLDKEIKKRIKPIKGYCCSAECKKKLQEKAKKEYNEKYNELKKLYMDSINPVIEAQKKARKKALKIGIAAVAGWFLLLGILIGMSKDSFDYWDKTQYANNSYPCYEFATFANKDGVFYHTENKKYAISLAYVENPIEVPDEVTEDTYKDYIQILEKQMNYGDSQENDEKFERKKLKKLLGKTQWLNDFPTGERLVFCIDVAELGKNSIKHKYAFVRIRLDDWGKIESVSNATNVYRYYTAVYNR